MKLLVTGGLGFIGSALVRHVLARTDHVLCNVDKMTYAADPASVAGAEADPRYVLVRADIADVQAMAKVFADFRPDAVMHLAAESHVDRSIESASDFVQSNVVGTFVLLEAARSYRATLPPAQQAAFRFIHVSTDEVYGDLEAGGAAFTEKTRYAPNSPYSASKAASDHFARAWHATYDLPVIITHCSNNYGPWQADEKLIPTMIRKALAGESLPVYGKGQNIRDWLYVDDHVQALMMILMKGVPGEVYNIGGNCEWVNLDIVTYLCRQLDQIKPRISGKSYADQIGFVVDRPGHDFRYAIDNTKITRELGWKPVTPFAEGLNATLAWYIKKYTR